MAEAGLERLAPQLIAHRAAEATTGSCLVWHGMFSPDWGEQGTSALWVHCTAIKIEEADGGSAIFSGILEGKALRHFDRYIHRFFPDQCCTGFQPAIGGELGQSLFAKLLAIGGIKEDEIELTERARRA